MKVVRVEDLYSTDREVDCPKLGFKSMRILLESDGMGYTLTKTLVPKGPPQMWHYKSHLESCFCVSGLGLLTSLETGERHVISPDSTYVLDKHDPHTFEALKDTVLICVFNPPLKGREVHQEDGSY
jgi:L-ectoine synthase